MASWLQLLLLAIASMFWPTLILIVVVALRLKHPMKILVWFLAGGLLATVTIGIFVVFELQGSSGADSQSSVGPGVDICMGILSLLAAYALDRKDRNASPATVKSVTSDAKPTKPSVAERAVGGGAVVAFTAGIVLNLVPGTFPIVGLKDIAELNASDTAKVVSIIVFYLIMFTFVEAPIVAYGFAPAWTEAEMDKTNSWLIRNKRRIAVWVIAGVGAYLIARGVVQLL